MFWESKSELVESTSSYWSLRFVSPELIEGNCFSKRPLLSAITVPISALPSKICINAFGEAKPLTVSVVFGIANWVGAVDAKTLLTGAVLTLNRPILRIANNLMINLGKLLSFCFSAYPLIVPCFK